MVDDGLLGIIATLTSLDGETTEASVVIAITSSLDEMVEGWIGGYNDELLLDPAKSGILSIMGGRLVVDADAEAPPEINKITILNYWCNSKTLMTFRFVQVEKTTQKVNRFFFHKKEETK